MLFFGQKTETTKLDEIVNNHLRKLVQEHEGPCVAESAAQKPSTLKNQSVSGYGFKMGLALPEGA